MPHGYVYKCQSCQRRYEVLFESTQPSAVDIARALNDLKKGKYGENMLKAFQDTPNATIDARSRLFTCESCGRWSNTPDLTICQLEREPPLFDEETIRIIKEFEGVTLEYDTSGVPSQPVIEARRICRICYIQMHKHDGENGDHPDTLRCTYCGGECRTTDRIIAKL